MKRESECNHGATKCVIRATSPYTRFILFSADHAFFVGLQAHREFSTRPLNLSPPFLGLVAAACGPDVLEQQMAQKLQSFQPPHPKEAMIEEQALIQASREQPHAVGRERVLSGKNKPDVGGMIPRPQVASVPEEGLTVHTCCKSKWLFSLLDGGDLFVGPFSSSWPYRKKFFSIIASLGLEYRTLCRCCRNVGACTSNCGVPP